MWLVNQSGKSHGRIKWLFSFFLFLIILSFWNKHTKYSGYEKADSQSRFRLTKSCNVLNCKSRTNTSDLFRRFIDHRIPPTRTFSRNVLPLIGFYRSCRLHILRSIRQSLRSIICQQCIYSISAVCTESYSPHNDTVVLCRQARALSASRLDNDILVPDPGIGPAGRPLAEHSARISAIVRKWLIFRTVRFTLPRPFELIPACFGHVHHHELRISACRWASKRIYSILSD